MSRAGILLLNLGGPERLRDVRPFLYNLFSDPEIIRLRFPVLQAPLAWLISVLRSSKSEKNYQKIGGFSPLREITESQAFALQQALCSAGYPIKTYVGMRYWHPFTEEAIEQIKRDRITDLVILPLYPQFSISTSGSSFRQLEKIWMADPGLQTINYTIIPSWHDCKDYIRAIADLIDGCIDQQPDAHQAHLFFSAHGVPVSYVEEAGDPYQDEVEKCVGLIMKALNRDIPYTLAYQSRVGPIEWLKPYTDEAIVEVAQQGYKELVVVPISFVSDHIETLEEIDIEYREIAINAGIETFIRVPALNTNPDFIQALAKLVIQALSERPVLFSDVCPENAVKLYPQEQWAWGITPSAEVWNGRLAMFGMLGVLLEYFVGSGPLHLLGLM